MKIVEFIKSHTLILNLILIIGIILLGIHIYTLLTSVYLTIEFKELRPMHEKVYVFYKGLKIGRVTKMELCHDCQSTYVRVRLSYKGLKLPINTTAVFAKEKKKKKEIDFIELIYPKDPSQYLLSNGNIINGSSTIDVETYLANRDPDELEQIKENLLYSSENLNESLVQLSSLFVTMQDIIRQNQKNIYLSSGNLAQTTHNINNITQKFNNSLNQQSLDNTVSSLDNVSQNLQNISGNLAGTTTGLNNSMPRVDSALYQTQGILCNLNEITCGVKETMKKPFGGLRILFGKSIPSKKTRCCKP